MISVIRQFDDGMRVCVRLDDSVYLRWFAVEQGLRQDKGAYRNPYYSTSSWRRL